MYNYHYQQISADASLIADIAKAVNGQFSAVACYEQLAEMAPNEVERNQILEIRKDEIRHLNVFSHIYTS